MQSLGTNLATFIGLTIILVGGAALLAGRAIADNWKPAWQVLAATLGLAFADRFLTWALFGGELLNLPGFLAHYLVLAAMGLFAWRITRVGKLCRQYPWRYERRSLFTYGERARA
jgi:hypothetical protein